MKRAWSILLAVLLGAAVVGIGTGYFLHLANQDRQLLALEAENAKAAALRAQQEQQSAVEETNRKLQQASEEVTKAQSALKVMEWEKTLLPQAKPLVPPPSQTIQNWKLAISTSQGIALRFPPGSNVQQDDEKILSVVASGTVAVASQAIDGPWIMVEPYSQNEKSRLVSRLATSTPTTYFVNGRLLNGRKGALLNDESVLSQAAVLEVYQNATTSHLIWIQTPPNQQPGRRTHVITLEDVLSTLDFSKQP